MARKIGEIFEKNGEWYQCVGSDMYDYCKGCASFKNLTCTSHYGNRDCRLKANCKKLEKFGEPYENNGKTYQLYKSPIPVDTMSSNLICQTVRYDIIEIEIKNQENMEEKKLNLKPFDLEAAKAGKPVCTRNGRKARIICFDTNDERPIIALLEFECDNGGHVEKIETYYKDGKVHEESEWVNDLMMLPQNHEGWINIYKTYDDKFAAMTGSLYLYKTEKEAKMEADPDKVLSTVKIEWEE